MPESLKELYDHIWSEAKRQDLTPAQTHYAVGWILFDVFERAEHEQTRIGSKPTADMLDKFAAELPVRKIERSMDAAQEEFGEAAASFMENEIQLRIKHSIDNSILREIKIYTSGFRTFFWNTSAGILSAVFFTILIVLFGFFFQEDPSPIQTSKSIIRWFHQSATTDPQTAPVPSPTQPK